MRLGGIHPIPRFKSGHVIGPGQSASDNPGLFDEKEREDSVSGEVKRVG